MTRATRVTAFVLLVLILTSIFCSYAMAAKVCTHISGGIDKAVVFTVKTNKKWLFASKYLVINFRQGVGIVEDTGKEKKTCSDWNIYVYDSKGNLVQQKSNNYSSSVKIKGLNRNSTYTIKIVEDTNMRKIGSRIFTWVKEPSWYVGTTKNITLCK